MSDTQPVCELCGEPMPAGETMFKYHGYSGPCPKPPLSVANDGVIMLAQDAAFARRDKSLFMVKEGSEFVPAACFVAAETELASIKREYLEDASTTRRKIDDQEELIAKLRRRLAARDTTIAELTKNAEQADESSV